MLVTARIFSAKPPILRFLGACIVIIFSSPLLLVVLAALLAGGLPTTSDEADKRCAADRERKLLRRQLPLFSPSE